jgi:hypothetical protein
MAGSKNTSEQTDGDKARACEAVLKDIRQVLMDISGEESSGEYAWGLIFLVLLRTDDDLWQQLSEASTAISSKLDIISSVKTQFEQLSKRTESLAFIAGAETTLPDSPFDVLRLIHLVDEIPRELIGTTLILRIYGGFCSSETELRRDVETPHSIADLLISIARVFHIDKPSLVYDPCTGSPTFARRVLNELSADRFIGQDIDYQSGILAQIVTVLDGDKLDIQPFDATGVDLFPSVKVNAAFCAIPFDTQAWGSGLPGAEDMSRWPYGVPAKNRGNGAWLQQVLAHCSDEGYAFTVLPGSLLAGIEEQERALLMQLLTEGRVYVSLALPARLYRHMRSAAHIVVFGPKRSEQRANTLFISVQEDTEADDALQRTLSDKTTARILAKIADFLDRKAENEKGFAVVLNPEQIKKLDSSLLAIRFVDIDFLFAKDQAPTVLEDLASLRKRLEDISEITRTTDQELIALLKRSDDES